MPTTSRTFCECGVSVTTNGKYFDAVEAHTWTEKHQLMLKLKETDLESHKLAVNEKSAKIKCKCGVMVCRWSLENHRTHCPTTAKQRAIASYLLTQDFAEADGVRTQELQQSHTRGVASHS